MNIVSGQKTKILLRIIITHIGYEFTQPLFVIGQLAFNHILANQVAQNSTEVFVAWERHKTARLLVMGLSLT